MGDALFDVRTAFDEAGLGVIFITVAGQVDATSMRVTGYTTFPNKTATADFQKVTNGSKAAAVGAAEAYAAAHPGTLVVDTTA
jgi:hypothetical protein